MCDTLLSRKPLPSLFSWANGLAYGGKVVDAGQKQWGSDAPAFSPPELPQSPAIFSAAEASISLLLIIPKAATR